MRGSIYADSDYGSYLHHTGNYVFFEKDDCIYRIITKMDGNFRKPTSFKTGIVSRVPHPVFLKTSCPESGKLQSEVCLKGEKIGSGVGAMLLGGCYTVNAIEQSAFRGCEYFTSIDSTETIPATISYIGDSAFMECPNLRHIVLPNSIGDIGNSAFAECLELETVVFPDEFQNISDNLFYNCKKLSYVKLPTRQYLHPVFFGDSIFYGCESLNAIYIPKNIDLLGRHVFSNCKKLKFIILDKNTPPYTTQTESEMESFFHGVDKSEINVFLPKDANMDDYNNSLIWQGCNFVPIPDLITLSSNNLITIDNNGESNSIIITPDSLLDKFDLNYHVVLNEADWIDIEYRDNVIEYSVQPNLTNENRSVTLKIWLLSEQNFKEITISQKCIYSEEVKTVVNPQNAGTVSGAGKYTYNTNVTLTATSATGYKFANWTSGSNVISSQNPFVFPVVSDSLLTANFELLEFDILAIPQLQGSGTVWGSGKYTYGSEVILTASPAIGYNFIGWVRGTEGVSIQNPYTFTATEDVSIKAVFEAKEYNITAIVNPENTGTVSGAGKYSFNSQASLTASANDGYKFIGWYAENTQLSSANPYIFAVTENVSIKAVFEAKEYDITAVVNPENAGTVSGAGKYRFNSQASLTASTISEYEFAGWYIGNILMSSANPYRFIVTENVRVTAKFKAKAYIITPLSSNNGKIIPSTPQTVKEGEDATFWFIPDNGYSTEAVIVNSTSVSFENNEYTIKNIVEDMTISVSFELAETGVQLIGDTEASIYPNPTSGIINIESRCSDTPLVRVYSIYGKLLLEKKSSTIDISQLTEGMYVININEQNIKVIKQ